MATDARTANSLRIGSVGPAVVSLQKDLAAAGYQPGPCDGDFGARTQAALVAWQASVDLPADGVAGRLTLAQLAQPNGHAPAHTLTLADVTAMFPDTPHAPIARNLPIILAALADSGLATPQMTLIALATIRAEAECFEPLEERVGDYNTRAGGHPFDLYDRRQDLGNLGPPDGAAFRGRGYVQLTGRGNYASFGRAIGLPSLVETPWRACEPALASRLLAAFLHARAPAIEAALAAGDLARARRAVNGGTHGLDRFEAAYRIGTDRLCRADTSCAG